MIFNGIAVAKVNDQKHLGLILDSRLTFERHINKKIIKAKRNLGIINYLSNFLPLKTLDQMYKALFRSHLDYCDIIYHMPSKQNQAPLGITLNSAMEKVKRIQYQSALAISDAWHGSSRTKLHEELGWESLSDRRVGRRILQIHNIFNNMTPSYLNDKLPPKCSAFFSGNTRNAVRQIICKSNRLKNSFSLMQLLPGISLLNILITFHFLIFLKNILILFFRPKANNIFGIHDPVGLRYLFQLRVNLSPLRSHKFRHNFADPLLRYVVIKALKIQIISCFHILTM